MKFRLRHLARLMIVSILLGGSTVALTGQSASASSCTSCVTVTTSTYNTGYQPGDYTVLNFELKNPLTMLTQKITLRITLPDGIAIDPDSPWGFWPDNGSFAYNSTTRVVTVQPESSTGVIGSLNPKDSWSFSLSARFDDDLTAPEVRVKSTVAWATKSGTVQTPTVGNDIVFTPSKPYVLETETSFSPSPVSSGGSSTMTSTITNTGTGTARSIYFYMKFDPRLTVDTSSVPADCEYRPEDTWESWTGETIVSPHHLDCHYSPALAPGQTLTYTVNVTAPAVSGPDEFEGSTELSCTSSGEASHDATEDGDSVGLLLLNPSASAELHVVQMGGPEPIAMPTADAEPLQPTAGKTHALTTYAYNVGGTDITTDVTVVVTIPEGFTPTAIRGETNDSGASAPVCTLATRTCVFSRLGTGKQGTVYIEGDLSPTIQDKSKLSVSAQASAATVTTATDTAAFAVTALADVRVSLTAAGAYVSGSPVTFLLSAQNLGPSDLKSPVIKVTIPSGGKFTSVPKGCTATGTTMTCKWSKLEAEGIDGEEFTATFGSASKASASAVLTSSTPLTKDSVTKDSVTETAVSPVIARAIAVAIVESNSAILPATGSGSNETVAIAAMLMMGGVVLVAQARRRRVL